MNSLISRAYDRIERKRGEPARRRAAAASFPPVVGPAIEWVRMSGRARIGCAALAALAAALLTPAAAAAADCPLPGAPGLGMSNTALDVSGDIDAARTGGYLQIPFTVPAGTTGIQVRYSYDNQNDTCTGPNNDTLDMGVYQPKSDPSSPAFEQSDRRGWSGSAVKNLAIAENGFSDETTYNANRKAFVDGRTTRAYEPGPIPAGTWAVELGIAYVDPADADGIRYHVEVRTSTDTAWSDDPYAPSGPPPSTVNQTPGWYTGDVHVHGEMEPGNATMNQTFDAAFGPGGAGLDFITLVDHNNDVAHDDMRTQADRYPGNLVIPGTEMTTYRGHWNAQSSSKFADFRGGPIYTPDALTSPIPDSALTKVQDAALPKDQFGTIHAGGGWTQINHPTIFETSPSLCRGCFWNYSDGDTDFSKVDAIEIQTGPAAIPQPNPSTPNPFTATAIAYYEHALDSGAHIAAVGSSDDHKAGTATGPFDSSVGEGATVVHSQEGLNRQGIIDAVRADHTYVKPFGPSGPDVTLKAKTDAGSKGIIGDTVAGGSFLTLHATVDGAATGGRAGDWSLVLLNDGVPHQSKPFSGDGTDADFAVLEPSGRYSIEVLRSSAGKDYVEAYSSPIWFSRFSLGKPHLNKGHGTAKVRVRVSGAGTLELHGKSLRTVDAKARKPATKKLKVKPQGKLARKLRKRGRAKVHPRVTFTPDGGKPGTEKLTVKLKRKG